MARFFAVTVRPELAARAASLSGTDNELMEISDVAF